MPLDILSRIVNGKQGFHPEARSGLSSQYCLYPGYRDLGYESYSAAAAAVGGSPYSCPRVTTLLGRARWMKWYNGSATKSMLAKVYITSQIHDSIIFFFSCKSI